MKLILINLMILIALEPKLTLIDLTILIALINFNNLMIGLEPKPVIFEIMLTNYARSTI